MSGMAIGLSIFAGLLVLLALRIHVGVGMLIGGAAGFMAMNDWDSSALLFTLNHLAYARLSNYDLAVIPLFMLMGQFATQGGLSRDLFKAAAAFVGHIRGGLGYVTIVASILLSALSGSAVADAKNGAAAQALDRITLTADIAAAVADADLVIEAIPAAVAAVAAA